MSDEEEQYEEEVEEEYEETAQEVEQKKTVEQHEEEQVTSPKEKMTPAVQQALEVKEDTKQHLRRAPPPKPREPDGHEITEAEQKMLDVKKRHEEEEEAKIRDNDERRRQELHQVEDELRQLRERQVQRKAEREQEEADLAAKRRQDEERRRKAEEERKARIEEEKWHRDEERRKRQLMLGGAALDVEGGRPQQMAKSKRKGLTPEEQAAAKRNYIAGIRPADVSNMLPNDIKIKIKQLYARILKLEGDKYDLEKRKDRQEYDIKELGERQRQQARHKAIDSGVDPTEMENTNLPPKIRVASKFDRQTDRRDYGERRDLFESPVVKPAPSLVHGSGRPPANWGRKEFEELEQLRKNMEPPKYFEEVKAEGDAARPPVPVIPLQLPPDAEVEVPASGKKQQVNGGKQVNGTSAAAAEAEAAGWRERAAQKQKQMPAPPPKEKKVRV